jgi:hypothetical protein
LKVGLLWGLRPQAPFFDLADLGFILDSPKRVKRAIEKNYLLLNA